ncbi:MAG: rhomboid family intramembrane serine protease [Armatimonadota bacterium]|nr:rhomboid family intramembrane serine protease [bacterium]
MRGSSTTEKIAYWLFADRIPVTKGIIVLNVATLLAAALSGSAASLLFAFLGFNTPTFLQTPWTMLTYPLVWPSVNPLAVFFAGYWLWFAGGSLERSWGTKRFAGYFFTMSAISALGLFAGSILTHVPISTFGLWLPLAGVTISYAMLNPEQQILFFFVIPIKLKYLALIDAIILFVSYVTISPLLGVFALIGAAFAYWYVMPRGYRAPRSEDRGQVVHVYRRKRSLGGLNPLNWIRERRERDKLRKLFKDSGFKDDDTTGR